MDGAVTDTVVMITDSQYQEMIQYLHTLDVKCGDLSVVLKMMLALIIVYMVTHIWYTIINNITRYI